MSDRDLLKQALEALEEAANVLTWDGFAKAADALRERLAREEQSEEIVCVCGCVWEGQELISMPPARQEQEPVAWIEHGLLEAPDGLVWKRGTIGRYTPLYTAPQREWVGLTEEQINVLAMDSDGMPNSHLEFARAIEAKLREKNT